MENRERLLKNMKKMRNKEKEILELKRIIEKNNPWYYSMNLGHGLRTPVIKEHKNLIPVVSLLQYLNLEGLKCLDMGCIEGKMAFLMNKLGGDVIAIDVAKREGFLELNDFFKTGIKSIFPAGYQCLSKIRKKQGLFDFILCAGIFYHLYSPFNLLFEVRKSLKQGGYALFESACIPEGPQPKLYLNDRYYNDFSTIFIPSLSGLRFMIEYSCFEIVAEASFYEKKKKKIMRHAILAKAVNIDKLKKISKNKWISQIYREEIHKTLGGLFLPHKSLTSSKERIKIKLKPILDKHKFFVEGKEEDYKKEIDLLEIATPAKIPCNIIHNKE